MRTILSFVFAFISLTSFAQRSFTADARVNGYDLQAPSDDFSKSQYTFNDAVVYKKSGLSVGVFKYSAERKQVMIQQVGGKGGTLEMVKLNGHEVAWMNKGNKSGAYIVIDNQGIFLIADGGKDLEERAFFIGKLIGYITYQANNR